MAVDGVAWYVSRSGRFIPREGTPGIHLIGDWVDCRDGLGAVVKKDISVLSGIESRRRFESIHCTN
jgi:hypothetical protein